MNINKFTEEVDNKVEYKYRCLVYPNITYQKDFTKDSYYIIMSRVLEHLTKLRPDIHFTVLTPEIMPGFQYKNTEQVIYEQPSYPNTMRCHFDTKRLMEIIDWKNKDWDFVYTYLPEHTLQLKNLFYNVTNCKPIFFGYCAYIEIPATTKYDMSMLHANFNGILEMNTCGVNSQALKDEILKQAKVHLSGDEIKRMEKIIKPLYRGWDNVEGERKEPITDEKIIVFNHRPNTYKSYPWFLKQMDKLWEQRKDFKVWVPLSNTKDREYIYIDKFNRQGYFTELSKCWVGVCGKSYHKGWVNSAADGMSVGTPYVFLNADYYSECIKDSGIYFNDDDEFMKKINKVLDDENYRNEYSKKSKKIAKQNTWEEIVKQYNQHFILAENELKQLKNETDSYLKMKKYILNKGYVSKRQLKSYLNWGIRIPFDSYRNKLRQEKNIKFTKNGYGVK
tara:strand:- start:1119 stop:2462 length:1344 start_codon:yes stop_codon:yes gene_type:complete